MTQFKMFSSLAVVFSCTSLVFSAVVKTLDPNEGQGCSIKLNTDLPSPRKQPLYLERNKSKFNVAIPTVENKEGKIVLKTDEKIILSCPGENNYLTLNHKSTSEFSCVKNTTLSLPNSGELIDTRDGVCAKPVHAILKATSQQCGGRGKIYQIGFKSRGWQLEVSVCHDTSTSNSLYSKHEVVSAVQGSEKDSVRPKFEEGGLKDLYVGFDPDDYYKQTSQKYLFVDIFGEANGQKYYDKAKGFYIARGHLAPHADFIYGIEQHATYFYINVAPQWQIINAGNWLTVERMVRNHAIQTKKQLTVFTGTYGILKLEGDNGREHQLYLNNDQERIPVSQYFWKVVYDPKSKEGIAILTSNNPFLENNIQTFCKTECGEFGWIWLDSGKQFRKPTKGLTTCCSVSELRTKISHLPPLNIRRTMEGVSHTLKKSQSKNTN